MSNPLSFRWDYPTHIGILHGVAFYYGVEHDDGDVRKFGHAAVFQNGKIEDIDWNPYLAMSLDDCARWLRLGRPCRQGAGPLDRAQLQQMEQGVAISPQGAELAAALKRSLKHEHA